MNEEIEYAEMLEIPVSTVNVVRKSRKRKKHEAAFSPAQTEEPALKDTVIAIHIHITGYVMVIADILQILNLRLDALIAPFIGV